MRTIQVVEIREERLRVILSQMLDGYAVSDQYRNGLIIGMMSVLMACGASRDMALAILADNMPEKGASLSKNTIPEPYLSTLQAEMKRRGKTWVEVVTVGDK